MRTGLRCVRPLFLGVRRGSSASTVPIPVSTASHSVRSTSTYARDRSPVISRRVLPVPPTAPSRVAAILSESQGRPRRIRLAWPASSSSAASAKSPVSTLTPCRRNLSTPAPETRGFGSSSETTHRRTPASTSALAHGGVAPVWEQGSRVTYAVAPCDEIPALASASASACGRPPLAVRPDPTSRPARTRMQATGGFGQDCPMERRARCRQRAIQR